MSLLVHALAHRPLTVEAVAELVGLPTEPAVDDATVEDVVRRRGWSWEHELVSDALLTAHGHVLCSEDYIPFGDPGARTFLVFGELYPVDPHDDEMQNARWLLGRMDAWEALPGWTGTRPATSGDCEGVLATAADAVTAYLGSAPERTVVADEAIAAGPALTHRVWRTATHALVLGPCADNGPYGYLTHLQLSSSPLACDPELPAAADEDALRKWIATHIDW